MKTNVYKSVAKKLTFVTVIMCSAILLGACSIFGSGAPKSFFPALNKIQSISIAVFFEGDSNASNSVSIQNESTISSIHSAYAGVKPTHYKRSSLTALPSLGEKKYSVSINLKDGSNMYFTVNRMEESYGVYTTYIRMVKNNKVYGANIGSGGLGNFQNWYNNANG